MLFDLRGRRKRFIQVVYLILAILFGGSLVLFGIGSDAPGGLVDAISGNQTGGGGDATDTFEDEVERAQRRVRANPKDPQAWASLAQAQVGLAQAGDDYDRETGQFTEGAVDEFREAAAAWERHLELKPKRPDATTASRMVQVYGTLLAHATTEDPEELFDRAAQAQRIFAQQRPSPSAWYQLAGIYYQTGKIAEGDRAADRAIELTPRDQRNVVRSQLDDFRKEGVRIRRRVKESEKQAEEAAQQARKEGQDPFGTPPVQTPLQSPGQ